MVVILPAVSSWENRLWAWPHLFNKEKAHGMLRLHATLPPAMVAWETVWVVAIAEHG